MDGLTVAMVSYIIAIIISLAVAGLIQLMVMVLARFTKEHVMEDHAPVISEASQPVSDHTAVAAVIAIAQKIA